MSGAVHTPGRALTEEQMRNLRECLSASNNRIGLRVSYSPGCKSLEARGLVEKRGRAIHRMHYITDAGRAALAKAEGKS